MTSKIDVNESGRTFAQSETGGRKEVKPYPFHLLPWASLWEVARVFHQGALKYGERNWENGFDWSLSFDALIRHASQFWSGEDMDEETGCHHLAAVCFHSLVLMEFATLHPQGDDRPNQLHLPI